MPRMITILLEPDGVTLHVPDGTITTSYKGNIYRRVGWTLVFKRDG